ncbi:MAG: methionyl-tRNA formyltransferase [Nitrospirae bacterium]|nr:methionyl-tRNA formyltransferase [Nitrospirota bacterium]MBF0593168.1 methionyl-tRNA formyltransferase [Nitrospirota bacterium]
MKIVFFGTPEFGVPTLEALMCASPVGSRHEVVAVVTQPGAVRRGKTQPSLPLQDAPASLPLQDAPASPVELAAQRANLMVIAPQSIRQPDVIETLRALRPDVAVIVAYGKILPREILTIPKMGCINVHPSLLPRYRGAAPMQWAIINGDTTTGVCTMLLDEGLDTGPVFLCREQPILESDTAETLSKRLSQVGAELLISTLDAIEHNGLTPQPQRGIPSIARPLKKEDGLINWNSPARDIVNLIRGLHPWPGTYTYFNGQRVKILKATVLEGNSGNVGAATVVKQDKCGGPCDKRDGLVISTGGGLLSIDIVQPDGKNPMPSSAFIRGRIRGQGGIIRVG